MGYNMTTVKQVAQTFTANATYEELTEGDLSSFRLTDCDMGDYLEIMGQLGMLDEHSTELPSHLAWHPEPVFGITVHKLCSSDNWLVTPTEIAAALESYRTHGAGEVKAVAGDHLDRWPKWIGFLGRAQRHGGFRVH